MKYKNPKKPAISMFELVVASAIISVLALTGFAGLSDTIKGQKTISGAGQVAYALKDAKYSARTKGVMTSVDTSIGIVSGELPGNVTVISNTCEGVYFDINGNIVDSSGLPVYNDCSVIIGYSGGPQKTITIKGKSGNVKYE